VSTDGAKANPYVLDDTEIDAFYAGESSNAGNLLGCRFIDAAGAYRFAVWAPNARSISVVGDFNGWNDQANPMETYRGIWVCFIASAKHGENYKYSIVGVDGDRFLKADPYAVHTETPPATASKIWDTDGYEWSDAVFMKKRAGTDIRRAPLSIYEAHIGSWRSVEGCEYPPYRETANRLAEYLKSTGFTHVELMPVNEYPFDGSWGYQVTGFFAITSRFGTPQDFMYFVDTMHPAGIGVIVDWVPAHFPKDAHGLARFDGTWLYEHANPQRREHPEWGTHEFNYCRPEVVSFLISSAVNLIDRYHVDGLRVDAVSSMLYLDYGRSGSFVKNKDGGNLDYEAADFLRSLNTVLLGTHKGVITVAEESTSYPLVTRPPYDGGLGFSFKWNMGFMHDTLDYMKGDPYFRHGAHEKMTFSMYYAFSEDFILPYSHDEVVHGKASMIGKMFGEYDQKFASLRTLYGFLFGHPGKKLMFMGQEFAQFIEWDYKNELDWLLLDYPRHSEMLAWVSALNKLYRSRPALYERDDSWDGFCWLNVEDRKNSVFAFLRSSEKDQMLCVYNFAPIEHTTYLVALPEKSSINLVLNSNEYRYGGTETKVRKRIKAKKLECNGMEYSAELALPPLTALFYQYHKE